MKTSKVQNVVLYHRNCSDGFGAAWAAWKKFGSKARYIGVNFREPLPEDLEGKDVYIVDFSYPVKDMKHLLKITKSLTLLDHHITAKPLMKIVKNHRYALNHSGAVLSWKYFHPDKPVPKLLLHIEDFDLWKFRLPHTHELMADLDKYELDFKVWNKIAAAWQNPKQQRRAIEEGRVILDSEKEIVQQIVDKAELVVFEGYKTLAVNTSVFISQVGHELYMKKPPIGIVWSERSGKLVVSLRSNKQVNVAKLAERFGGGGHRQASGFSIPIKGNVIKFPWKVVLK